MVIVGFLDHGRDLSRSNGNVAQEVRTGIFNPAAKLQGAYTCYGENLFASQSEKYITSPTMNATAAVRSTNGTMGNGEANE